MLSFQIKERLIELKILVLYVISIIIVTVLKLIVAGIIILTVVSILVKL